MREKLFTKVKTSIKKKLNKFIKGSSLQNMPLLGNVCLVVSVSAVFLLAFISDNKQS